METSNTSISGVRTDLLTPESDTSTCTMIVMERRPNALESGWNQKVMAIVRKVFTDNSWTIVKQKS